LKHNEDDKSRKNPSRRYPLSTGEERRSLKEDRKVIRPKVTATISKTDDRVQDTFVTLATLVKKGIATKMLPLNQRVKNTTRLFQTTRQINLLQRTG
jgi:hypothetical protein